MLERFKVAEGDEVRVSEESLRVTTTAVFEKMGVSAEDAAEGANTLVMSDLRGVETHGVSNMLRSYVQQYNDGALNPRPNWRILRESPGTATIDADNGLVVILGPAAMRMAIDKARDVGVGVVVMHNSGHSGAIGHHALLAAEADMVGMVMTGGWQTPSLPPSGPRPASAPTPWPSPPRPRRRLPSCSTPPHRPSPATSCASQPGWARTCFQAGSPSWTALPSWRRRP